MESKETFLASNGNTYTFSKWKILECESEKPTNVRWMKAGETFDTLEEAIAYRKEFFKNYKKTMKQKTIIAEVFEDIEKFGWNVVSTKLNFYLKKEKQNLLKTWIDGKEDDRFGNTVFEDAEQYYNDTYGKEESN